MLGRGSFGVVVPTKSGTQAMKQMRPSESARDCIPHTSVREVAALAALQGIAHVPTPFGLEAFESGVVQVHMQRLSCTLMEDQVRHTVKTRPVADIRSVVCNVGTALAHAHARGIAHRDIKLENIMMDARRSYFLIDWGLCSYDTLHMNARQSDEPLDRMTMDVGTPIYRSPEATRGEPYDVFAADVWALGIVCVELFIGKHPFHTKDNDVLRSQITHFMKDGFHRAMRDIERRDAMLAHVLRGMLHADAAKRWTMKSVVQHLMSTDVCTLSMPPAPVLPCLSTQPVAKEILRAHEWLSQLCVSWRVDDKTHDIAQWCFASCTRTSPVHQLDKRAACILVLATKALSPHSRFTASAQRVCMECGSSQRPSDVSVSADFRRLEAELLCMLHGRFFFPGVAGRIAMKLRKMKCPAEYVSIAVLIGHVAVVRCGFLYQHHVHDIVDQCVHLCMFVMEEDPSPITHDMILLLNHVRIECESNGAIVQCMKWNVSPHLLDRIRDICRADEALVVAVTDESSDDEAR